MAISADTPSKAREATPPEALPPSARRPRRLAWLDVLRGVAALVVVFEHSLDALYPEIRETISPWFDFGTFGVFLFFLVSGYVVPASLERRGSVRGFWIGRIFRLYPLWVVAAVIGVAFSLAKVFWALPDQLAEHPRTSALAHLTMLQDLLAVPNVLNVFWTLSYEMSFYLLVTAMFVFGVHRASAGLALTFGTAAAVAAGLGLPAGWLSHSWGNGVIPGVAALLVIGVVALISKRRDLQRCGAVVLTALVLVLLSGNSRVGAWESLIIIATMFAGTAVYRIEHGQLGRWPAGLLVTLVPILSITVGVWLAAGWGILHAQPRAFPWSWPTAIAAAWLVFGAGLALRHRRMPRMLSWLGLISYSIYLLHQLPLQVIRRLAGDPTHLSALQRLSWAAVLLTSVLVSSALAYRYIEQPMQRLGRRLSQAATRHEQTGLGHPARSGPDRHGSHPSAPAEAGPGDAETSLCQASRDFG